MDKQDIKTFRGWHRAAAERAVRAGFDIVYVYAGHGYLPMQFIVAPRSTTAATNMAAASRTAAACCGR